MLMVMNKDGMLCLFIHKLKKMMRGSYLSERDRRTIFISLTLINCKAKKTLPACVNSSTYLTLAA